jgi:hypothetical protein
MASPEQVNNIDRALNARIVDSIVPPIGLPVIESGRYVLDMRIHTSSPDVPYGEQWVRFTDNYEGTARALASVANRLAWVNFVAKPEITFRHSDLAVENGSHSDIEFRNGFPHETLTGQGFRVGENQYAVNYEDGVGATFKPYSQLVEDQELSPYMEAWVSRIISKQNRVHPPRRDVVPFAQWVRSRRPNDDFDATYFDD